ncbi:MAG: 23S rRNA pseudouridine(1911/1915/1917) synthase RluD [Pseudomonadota bacterium]
MWSSFWSWNRGVSFLAIEPVARGFACILRGAVYRIPSDSRQRNGFNRRFSLSDHIHQQSVPVALAGYRLDQALAQMFPEYSRSRLTQWLKSGEILVDGAQCKPRMRLAGGEDVRIAASMATEVAVLPQAVDIEVAYEDDDVLVLNKPAGLVVHPGAGNPDQTLQNGLLHRWPETAVLPRAGLIHRIDKETSGLLLVAKHLTAHTTLTRALAEREIHREYYAICHGVLTGGGTIDAPIGRHPRDRLKMAVRDAGRPAVTHYRVDTRFVAHTAVRVILETGRTHQIRVHFAHRKHALIGDPVYGGRLRIPPGNDVALAEALRGFRRQALHAQKLSFAHPTTGDETMVSAELPADLSSLRDALAANQQSLER